MPPCQDSKQLTTLIMNELEKELLGKEKEYQDTHSNGEESGESGSGGENVPPQPNQPF